MKYLVFSEIKPIWDNFLIRVKNYLIKSEYRSSHFEIFVPEYLFTSMLNGIIKEENNTVIYDIPVHILPLKICGNDIEIFKINEDKFVLACNNGYEKIEIIKATF